MDRNHMVSDFISVGGKDFQQQIEYIMYLLNYVHKVNPKFLSGA